MDIIPDDDAPAQHAVYFPRIEPPPLQLEDPYAGTLSFFGDRALLFAALSRAQGAFPPIPRTKEVEVYAKASEGGRFLYAYKYAPLDQVIEACRAALAANGLAYLEKILELKQGRLLAAYLTHSSGAYCESRILIPRAEKAQIFAGEVTFMRRIQRQCILGVSPEEDRDAPDDGESESRPKFTAPHAPTKSGEQQTVRDPDAPPPPPAKEITPAHDQADATERANAAAARATGELDTDCQVALDAFEVEIKEVKNRAQLSSAVERILGQYVKTEKTDQQAAAVMKRAREMFNARRKDLPR